MKKEVHQSPGWRHLDGNDKRASVQEDKTPAHVYAVPSEEKLIERWI